MQPPKSIEKFGHFGVDWSVSGPCVECEGVKVELEKGGRWKSEVGRVKV